MTKELEILLPLVQDIFPAPAENSVNPVWTGRLGRHDVVITQCGIGKVNAALGTDALLRVYSPDLVLNTGVAGALAHRAGVLDVVVADRVAYHDVWCGPGTPWGEAAGCPLYFGGASEVLALPSLAESDTIHHGLLCSGDIFVSGGETSRTILDRFPEALAVDMESGAIAQTCLRHKVPFCCIRVISDTPDEDCSDNAAQYTDFWNDAPKRTFGVLTSALNELR